ncbi:flagellar cap protein FliD N-terminal domain-containing protein [Arsenophonus endosymbiont of Aleurodicus floccissimus]|uniref:flagellar cap protein FliD N-terminal domain-containing protein n=1 Tax=Arsenophonus endosymbiont of Aleurodicus floccissimus TaxID=2152761 RepID=UPI000E6AF472|nr:flagellar cap protein FliD N-terminal domain-containing protein [Arsenophonus endosymbiont of Aleurodicus floccissimus]
MSNVTSLGVGSGMTIDQWLGSIKANENQRLRPLKQKQQKYNQKISAYGSLRAQLDKLQQASESLMKFDKISTTSVSKNHKTVTVSSDEKAVAVSYEVKVE